MPKNLHGHPSGWSEVVGKSSAGSPVPQIPTPRMAPAARVRRAGRAAAAASLPTSRILWGGLRAGAEAECLQTPTRANPPHCEAACHRIKWLRAKPSKAQGVGWNQSDGGVTIGKGVRRGRRGSGGSGS